MTMVPEAAAMDIAVRDWSVRRIDIRSPVPPDASPVVRLELEHPKRGRVTDIGDAPSAFDAAFIAAGRIVGVQPRLLSYNVISAAPVPGAALPISVVIGIELNGCESCGCSTGSDLVRCTIEAWLDAIARSYK